jgi:hypothetical protein
VQFSNSWRRVSDFINKEEKSSDGPLLLKELYRGDGRGDVKGDAKGDGIGDDGLLGQLQVLDVCINTSGLNPSSGLKIGCPGSLDSREHMLGLVFASALVFVPVSAVTGCVSFFRSCFSCPE